MSAAYGENGIVGIVANTSLALAIKLRNMLSVQTLFYRTQTKQLLVVSTRGYESFRTVRVFCARIDYGNNMWQNWRRMDDDCPPKKNQLIFI